MDIEKFKSHKRSIGLSRGTMAYADIGEGPAALFVHGVLTNSLLWRNIIGEASLRRCIAIDLPAHGDTQVVMGEAFSLEEYAELLVEFLDAVGVDQVDLVGNDTGGAISQMFAVRHTDRLRTLTLTNCDVQENYPPEAFLGAIELAKEGRLAPFIAEAAVDMSIARTEMGLGVGYRDPEYVTPELAMAYLGRYRSEEAGKEIEKHIASVGNGDLLRIEDEMRALKVPTLVLWGTDDIFFELSWAYWLKDNVPGVTEVVEVPGGKLFFVDEMGAEVAKHLMRHWESFS